MPDWLQLGAVGILGAALLAQLKVLMTLAQVVGRLESTMSVLVQLVTTREGVRMPDSLPPVQPTAASTLDLKGVGA